MSVRFARWIGVLLLAPILIGAVILYLFDRSLPGSMDQARRMLLVHLRGVLRDATIPAPPSIEGFSNSGPNVVVILLDCYRFDYLDRDAPNLEGFSRSGWRYDQHYAAAPWTKPSTTSLFTSLLPRKHWVIRSGGFKLPQEALTLAELMQAGGFETAAFVKGSDHLARQLDFDQGFDTYIDEARQGSKSLLREFFEWLKSSRPQRFFAYLHFAGTHDPYYHDNDLKVLLSAPKYAGSVDFSTIDYKFAVNGGRLDLTDDQVEHLKYVARGKARKIDREAFGAFLERFDQSGLGENTLVIVTSDHGDGFFEHGTVSHGSSLYQEEIHVPMVVRYPSRFAAERGFEAVGRDACPSSTVDVLPTVLDFVGLPPPEGIDGRSLVPAGPAPDRCARWAISEQPGINRTLAAAIVRDGFKMIEHYDQPPRFELYDLATDPGERTDLSGDRVGMVETLGAALTGQLNADGSRMSTWSEVYEAIPEDMKERLRSLGYID